MTVGSTRADALVVAPWRDLLQVLTAETDGGRDDQLRHLAAVAPRILGCSAALITLVDEHGWAELVATAGSPPVGLDTSAGLLGEVVAANRVLRLPGDGAAAAPPEGVHSLLGVPVRSAGRCVGGLYLLDRHGDRPFTRLDAQLAQFVAGTVATVVRRARLDRDHAQRQRWLTASADLTRRLLAGEHGDPLRLVAERVHDVADADLVAVVTAVPEAGAYRVTAAAGALAGRVAGRLVQPENTAAAEVIAEGAPRVLTGLSARPRRPELAEMVNAESAVLVPLTGAGIEEGMLAVVRSVGKPPFSTAEVEATTMFAAQMTLALQFAESRADRERIALLDERDRIARDLHDHVIQRLFAIGLTMQNVSGQLGGAEAKRLLAEVDDLDETIAQIRSTIYRLTTPILSAGTSIRLRVGRLIDEMEEVLGSRPEFEVHGPVDLSVPAELADDAVAVLREALTNVARHAEARSVAVRVAVDATELAIEVVDDGQGIGDATRRSGLANLRARAERRGGRLAVEPANPSGTQVTWRVPLGTGGSTATGE